MARFECRLILWQRAVDLCAAVYALTQKFPREELFGLTNQLRRASVSVASNIAEGYGRGSRDQFRQFLRIARGSYLEVQTQLVIAGRLGFADSAEIERVEQLASEVGRMLSSMLNKLQPPANPNP